MNRGLRLSLRAGCATVALAVGFETSAQEAPARSDGPQLDIITVTATKREESLQDVPVSVFAVTGDTLEDEGLQQLRDIGERTPNLKVQVPRGGPAALIGIRGVNSGFNYGFEQSVALVIDGVYSGRAESFRSSQIDVSRLEVLRGPQGTLFGKNATAGLVNITTADPSEEFEASLKTRFGSDSLVAGTAAVSAPLGDMWGARFVYNHQSQDAYLTNTGGGPDGGEYEDNNVRIKLVGNPLDNLTTKLIWERLESNVTGSNQQVTSIDGLGFWAFDPAGNPYDPGNGGCGYSPAWSVGCAEFFTGQDSLFQAAIGDQQSSNLDAFFDTVAHNIRAQADYDIGGYVLSYVGGYSDTVDQNAFDPDFSANPWLRGPNNNSAIQQSHEIRLQTPVERRLHGVVGFYYYNQNYQYDQDVDLFQAGLSETQPFVGYELFPGGPVIDLPNRDYAAYVNGVGVAGNRIAQFNQDTTDYAVFASATFEATDWLRLIVGGRYTDEEKEVDRFITNANGTLRTPDGDLGPPPGPTPALFANSFDTTVTPYCFSDRDQPVYDASVAEGLGEPCAPGQDRSESRFTPSITLQWDVTPEIMTYFNYSEGFKGGGFNPQARIPSSLEFEDETVDAFELGFKSTLLDGAMTLNGALFHQSYSDWQVTQFVNQVFVVGNAAEVTSQGVELDMLWQVSDQFRAGFSAGYTDATYDAFANAACTNDQLMVLNPFTGERAACAQDLAGVSTPLSPDFTAVVTLDYDIPLANLPFDGFVGSTISYSDEFLLSQQNDPGQIQDSYTLFNLRGGVEAKSGRWELAFLGRNLGDEDFLISAGDVPAQNGAIFGTKDRGRTFEAQLNIFFN